MSQPSRVHPPDRGSELAALTNLQLFDSLSDEQRAAVFADAARLVVLAGAGAGKTRVLVARVARLLWGAEPTPPERLLAVSFTRKACGEVKERLAATQRALGGVGALPTVDTFHALALKIVREGLRPTPRVLDEGPEAQSYFRRFVESDPWLVRRGIDRERLEEALTKLDTGVLTRAEVLQVRERFAQFKLDQGVMALDDLNALALRCLRDPALRRRWQERFDVVLVDEFQDVDDGQMALFEVLVGGGARFCLFGDDDQAIYRWRGSNPECLREVARRGDVHVVMLPTNYRSLPPILALAQRVVEGDTQRLAKPVVPARAGGVLPRMCLSAFQSEALAAEIKALLDEGRAPQEVCVLVRDHVDGRRVLRFLEKVGVPAVPASVVGEAPPRAVQVQTYHGAKGLEYPVVIMPFLDLGRFPNSRRLKRDRKGLMEELERVREAASELMRLRAARRRRLVRFWWVLQAVYLPTAQRTRPTRRLHRAAYGLAMAAEHLWRLLWSGDLRRSLALRERRARALDAQIAELRPRCTSWRALEEAAANWGAEARQVLAEERRLCYVAVTRARDRWIGISRGEAQLSPFIAELPEGLLQWVPYTGDSGAGDDGQAEGSDEGL